MQSLFFFLPLFSAQPTSLSLSFFFSRGPNSSLPPAHFPLSAQIGAPSPLPPTGGPRLSGSSSSPWATRTQGVRPLHASPLLALARTPRIPAAPIYSFARVLCLPSQTAAAFSAPNPSAAIRALELGAAAIRRSSTSPQRLSIPGLPPQGEKRRSPFLYLSSVSLARVSSPAQPFRPSPP